MVENTYPGKFIVFEGLDGSGQSTQTKLLADFLSGKGKKVLLTKEPTPDSEASKEIRDVLNKRKKIFPQKLQELFAKDRKVHLEKIIIPALKQSKTVVCDRYFFSSFAFGKADGLELERLFSINQEFLLPDRTFILKVRPEVCLERIENRGKLKTLFEEKEKMERVFKNYLTFPGKFKNIYLIDGEKPIEEVFGEVKKILKIR